MRTYLDCIPCFIRQTLDAARLVTNDEKMQEQTLREVLKEASGMNMSQPPPAMATRIHRIIRKLTGVNDPYRQIKEQSNKFALALYPELKRIVHSSAKPFETAVRLAIAGNIIDFGVHSAKMELDEEQIHDSIQDALKSEIDEKLISELRDEINLAGKILYLADNAGEIVFDRILIEMMPLEKITVAVKGHPIINDATMEDAKAVCLTDIVSVIDNGSDAPGTIFDLCSERFQKAFDDSSLIIAKGQGNYETLSAAQKNIFFLFRAKCQVIASHAGVPIGSIMIARNNG